MAFLPLIVFVLFMAALLYGLAHQLGRPSGWFGKSVMGKMLNQGNRGLIQAAVDALHPATGERIADIGFGGGLGLELIAASVKPARPVGIELSDAMIDSARTRFGETVELHRTDGSVLPLADASLDGMVSVNTIYFWPDPVAVLREFRRVLRPGGRLVLGIRKREYMRWSPLTWFGFRLYSADAIAGILQKAGFDAKLQNAGVGELTVIARPR